MYLDEGFYIQALGVNHALSSRVWAGLFWLRSALECHPWCEVWTCLCSCWLLNMLVSRTPRFGGSPGVRACVFWSVPLDEALFCC